jgi:hypothetical protein
MGARWLGAAATRFMVGLVEASLASSIPPNLEEVVLDAKMVAGFQPPTAGTFSFIVHYYRDGGGYTVPSAGVLTL